MEKENPPIKQCYYRLSAKAKIIINNKLVLVKEEDKDWDLPGGGVEHTETIKEGLKRELKEEICLTTEFLTDNDPTIFKMYDSKFNRPLLFLCFKLNLNNQNLIAPGKNVKIGLFSHDNLPQNINHFPHQYQDYIKDF